MGRWFHCPVRSDALSWGHASTHSTAKGQRAAVIGPGRRRSMRVLLSVPIPVTGKNTSDQDFQEETRTLVVNAHGALISLAARVAAGQEVTVANKATQHTQECRIVYLGDAQGGKTQMGIEFVKPSRTFWQIDFPPDDWVVPEELIGLRAPICRSRGLPSALAANSARTFPNGSCACNCTGVRAALFANQTRKLDVSAASFRARTGAARFLKLEISGGHSDRVRSPLLGARAVDRSRCHRKQEREIPASAANQPRAARRSAPSGSRVPAARSPARRCRDSLARPGQSEALRSPCAHFVQIHFVLMAFQRCGIRVGIKLVVDREEMCAPEPWV